jgi:hypothetical protein
MGPERGGRIVPGGTLLHSVVSRFCGSEGAEVLSEPARREVWEV